MNPAGFAQAYSASTPEFYLNLKGARCYDNIPSNCPERSCARPLAAPAAAAIEPDPVFATIERHRELSDRLSAATAVSAKLMDGPEFEAADEISAARAEDLREYADTLLCTEPMTMEGAVALTRYVASLGAWQLPDDGHEGEFADNPSNWQKVFLETLADALENIRARDDPAASTAL